MAIQPRMVLAVLRRNFTSYFLNPTGYLFITAFILLGAMAAFWRPAFFLDNLATLDQLNRFFPLLMVVFAPALAMNAWSEERRLGTEELLLTLPGRDADVVLGKYLAVLGIHTVAVLLSLSHVAVLAWLGDPDPGLVAATYLGYWLLGAALLAVAMIGSLLSSNATVAFLIGAALCAAFVFADVAAEALGPAGAVLAPLGVRSWFEPFGEGLVPMSGVLSFVGLAAVMLYLGVGVIGRRHVAGGERSAEAAGHLAIRSISLGAIAICLATLSGRAGAAVDATSERLHTLQPATAAILDAIPEDRRVTVEAFVSPEVPEPYVTVRRNLVTLLRRFDELAGPRLEVAIRDTEPFTETASLAAENHGIVGRDVLTTEGARRGVEQIFLGVVLTSGPETFTIPFLDPGLPVEYELARSVRVVSRADRKRIGVVATPARVFGGFDFQTMSSLPAWSLVEELRKQYEVVEVPAEGPYPEDLDAVVAVMPSALPQTGLDALRTAIEGGLPALLLDDPLPTFDPSLAMSLPADAGRSPFQQNQAPPEPKGDVTGFLAGLGLRMSPDVTWSGANPYPAFADAPPEIVFLSAGATGDAAAPFDPRATISAGLQEMVLLYPGRLDAGPPIPGAELERDVLLTATGPIGTTPASSLLQRGFLGLQLNPDPTRFADDRPAALAMRVRGTLPAEEPDDAAPAGAPAPEQAAPEEAADAAASPADDAEAVDGETGAAPEPKRIDVVLVADADVVSEQFFALRRRGIEGLDFDNVTFALNCIDVLAGDESFVDLRTHRPQHRSLTRLETVVAEFTEAERERREEAEAEAAARLAEAQDRLDERVAEIRGRDDLDERTRRILERSVQEREQRRLTLAEARIEQEKERAVAAARAEMEASIASTQQGIRVWAAVLPPVPALVLAGVLFARRRAREAEGVPAARRSDRDAPAGGAAGPGTVAGTPVDSEDRS